MSDCHIEVRLQPGAHRDEIVGLRDGVLVARVCAPPVDGEANHALCRLVAHRIGIAPTRITVVSGKQGRLKLLRVAGLDHASAIEALGIDGRGN